MVAWRCLRYVILRSEATKNLRETFLEETALTNETLRRAQGDMVLHTFEARPVASFRQTRFGNLLIEICEDRL